VARVTYDKELTALLVIDPYEEMHAVLDLNIPNYANSIVTTNEIVDLISSG
jgi:hypothetical protein